MKRRSMAIVPLIAVLTLGCDDPISIDPSDLAGTWTALTYSWLDKADLMTVYDMIPDGGSFSVTLGSDGSFSAMRSVPGEAAESWSGIYSVTPPQLTFSNFGDGTPEPFLATRQDNDMTLVTGNAEFDFDGNGTPDPAQLSIFLRR